MDRMDLRIVRCRPFYDKAFALAFAISPILSHYRGPFVNAGITLLILLFPFEIIKLTSKRNYSKETLRLLLPMALYWVFKILDHGTSVMEIGQVLVYIALFMVFASGSVDTRLHVYYATIIACFASLCVIFQYFCYYILGFHLQIVPTRYLLPSAQQWVLLAQTGVYSITGRRMALYRPSAFFLEPSHMFIYLCAPLYYELLSPAFRKREKRLSVLLSLGMVLSTSGIGILATAVAWLTFFAKRKGKDNRFSLRKLLYPKNFAVLGCLAMVFLIMFFKVDFFHRSVARIFSSGADYTNAVSGRISSGFAVIRQFNPLQMLIGISDHYSEVEAHMTGFAATMYKYGIIGVILSYIFYIRGLFELKEQFFWISGLLIATSFFNPHTHGTIYMLFFIVFLLEGYRRKNFDYLFQGLTQMLRKITI